MWGGLAMNKYSPMYLYCVKVVRDAAHPFAKELTMKCEDCRYWGFSSCPDEVDGKCMKDALMYGEETVVKLDGKFTPIRDNQPDRLVDRDCAMLDGRCNCEYPFKHCKHIKLRPKEPEIDVPVCIKDMTQDTCPFNPLLGCDCGLNPPNSAQDRSIGPVIVHETKPKSFKDEF